MVWPFASAEAKQQAAAIQQAETQSPIKVSEATTAQYEDVGDVMARAGTLGNYLKNTKNVAVQTYLKEMSTQRKYNMIAVVIVILFLIAMVILLLVSSINATKAQKRNASAADRVCDTYAGTEETACLNEFNSGADAAQSSQTLAWVAFGLTCGALAMMILLVWQMRKRNKSIMARVVSKEAYLSNPKAQLPEVL